TVISSVRLPITCTSNPTLHDAHQVLALTVYPNPVAAAGPPQAACEDDDAGPGHTFTSLGGQARNGTPKWSVVSRNPAALVVTFGNEKAAYASATWRDPGTGLLRVKET